MYKGKEEFALEESRSLNQINFIVQAMPSKRQTQKRKQRSPSNGEEQKKNPNIEILNFI